MWKAFAPPPPPPPTQFQASTECMDNSLFTFEALHDHLSVWLADVKTSGMPSPPPCMPLLLPSHRSRMPSYCPLWARIISAPRSGVVLLLHSYRQECPPTPLFWQRSLVPPPLTYYRSEGSPFPSWTQKGSDPSSSLNTKQECHLLLPGHRLPVPPSLPWYRSGMPPFSSLDTDKSTLFSSLDTE